MAKPIHMMIRVLDEDCRVKPGSFRQSKTTGNA